MIDRWVVLLAGVVGAVPFYVSGHKPFAVASVCVGIMLAGRIGPRAATGERLFSTELRRRIFARDGGRCAYCGRSVHYEMDCPAGGCDACYEADHVEAWADGGGTTFENGAASCRRCNRSKSDRDVEEWLADPDEAA